MKLKPFPKGSSNLDGYHYNSSSMELIIRFRSGTGYCYYDVPLSVVTGLLAADSHGSYFGSNIRNNFRYTQLDRVPEVGVAKPQRTKGASPSPQWTAILDRYPRLRLAF